MLIFYLTLRLLVWCRGSHCLALNGPGFDPRQSGLYNYFLELELEGMVLA